MIKLFRSPLSPLIIAILCAAVWSTATFVAPNRGTPWADEVQYHVPTIREFANQFPRFDLVHYNAATTPGYHLALALVLKLTGSDAALRIANACFAAGCLLAVMLACRSRVKWGWVFALALLASPYFHYSALWIRPDNASWMLVFILLALASQPRFTVRKMLLAALVLVLLVLFRHVHLWAAAVLWAAAYLDEDGALLPSRPKLRRLGMMMTLTLPAFAMVAYFVRIWHGLVPPGFQTVSGALPPGHSTWQHEGPNWSVPMFIMALFGLIGSLFLPMIARRLRPVKMAMRPIACGIAIALPIALLVPSNWDESHGRRSGLWNIAQQLPAPMDRSVLLVPLSLLGGAVLAWMLASLPRRARVIAIVTLLAFVAAQTANAMAWQKYYEPFVVGWLGLICAQLSRENDPLTPQSAADPQPH
ncbi:MAG: hypothetical protein H7144_01520 [Burkholderiales bacterium]|nr:hypothetical protein [Phycisphaerae bacterium]